MCICVWVERPERPDNDVVIKNVTNLGKCDVIKQTLAKRTEMW